MSGLSLQMKWLTVEFVCPFCERGVTASKNYYTFAALSLSLYHHIASRGTKKIGLIYFSKNI